MSNPCAGYLGGNCRAELPSFQGCRDKKTEEEEKLEEADLAKKEEANESARQICLSLGAVFDGSSGCQCFDSHVFRNVVRDEQSYLELLI